MPVAAQAAEGGDPGDPLAVAEEVTPAYQILLLHSYHKGMTWSDDITAGVEFALGQSDVNAEVTIEYMETKRIFDAVHYENLRRLYQHKFAPDTFDLIITADDNALDFILQYRDRLFPGVPVVFCAVNLYEGLQSRTDCGGACGTHP